MSTKKITFRKAIPVILSIGAGFAGFFMPRFFGAAGWKFKWNRNVNTTGGMVICLPVNDKNLSKNFSIYAAGGPIASVF